MADGSARIDVTDAYSIENYLSPRPVLQRFYANAVKLTGVTFDESTIFKHYDEQLSRFRRMLVPTMAWAAVYRQAGTRPNLNNIQLEKLCQVDGDCTINTLVGERIKHLNHVTEVPAALAFQTSRVHDTVDATDGATANRPAGTSRHGSSLSFGSTWSSISTAWRGRRPERSQFARRLDNRRS